MNWLDYVTIGFALFGFAFIIFAIVQVILLRTRMRQMYQEMATSEDRVKTGVLGALDSSNKLQVYALKVDNRMTMALSATNIVPFKTIESFVVPYGKYMTLTCTNRVESKTINYNAAGILVLEASGQADVLANDLVNNRVQYLIINDALFDARYDMKVESNIKQTLMKQFPQIFQKVASCKLLVLYSPEHEASASLCTFNLKLFSGQSTPPRVSGNTIDVASMIGISSGVDTTIVYAMAYSTPK